MRGIPTPRWWRVPVLNHPTWGSYLTPLNRTAKEPAIIGTAQVEGGGREHSCTHVDGGTIANGRPTYVHCFLLLQVGRAPDALPVFTVAASAVLAPQRGRRTVVCAKGARGGEKTALGQVARVGGRRGEASPPAADGCGAGRQGRRRLR